MTRDEARSAFISLGLTYDVLTKSNVASLRKAINKKMKSSGLVKSTLRMTQRAKFYSPPQLAVELYCRSFYFEKREAVTFNSDGFIGFGGWADANNIQPILAGFVEWCQSIATPSPETNCGGET